MTRPCGCTSDPIVFGHSHPDQPVIVAITWRIVPAGDQP